MEKERPRAMAAKDATNYSFVVSPSIHYRVFGSRPSDCSRETPTTEYVTSKRPGAGSALGLDYFSRSTPFAGRRPGVHPQLPDHSFAGWLAEESVAVGAWSSCQETVRCRGCKCYPCGFTLRQEPENVRASETATRSR